MKKHLLLITTIMTISLSCVATGCIEVSEEEDDSPSFYQVDGLTNTIKDCQLSAGYDSLNTTGEVKVLVVPVQLARQKEWTDSMLEELRIAFFGEAEETKYWESVASFYYKSSYGQLKITGEVTDVYQSSLTIQRANEQYTPNNNIIPSWYAQADPELLKEYDTDNNGHVDATIFIYSNSYTSDASDNFWAWCEWTSADYDLDKPNVATYMWASYSFMHDDSTLGIDAHTYIHEFGHLLGLDDYYGSGDDGYYNAAGQLEMQSYNVGDQSMVTKMQLGWVNPIVVNGTQKTYDIPLRSGAYYPDVILLNDNWTGGAEDEYILIEYYTPEGNNERDAQSAYQGRAVYQMYTDPGLRIYHVDARLGKIHPRSGRFISYSDQIYDDGYVYYPAASNNSAYWSYLDYPYNQLYKLSALMQADVSSTRDSNHFANGGWASNNTLYREGDVFVADNVFFPNGDCFNNGNKVGYAISLTSEEDGVAMVHIQSI